MDSENLQLTTELFLQHLFSQDKTVNSVLKAHMITETIMEKILEQIFPVKDDLGKTKRFNFNQKVELCYLLNGFDERAYQVVKALNKVRNSCAHELKHYLTISDLSPIASALGKDISATALSKIDGIDENDNARTIYITYLLSATLGVLCGWQDIAKAEIK